VLCEAFRSRRALLHRGETFMFILAQAEETDLFEYKSDLKKKHTLYVVWCSYSGRFTTKVTLLI
jgi:hypothetical protein